MFCPQCLADFPAPLSECPDCHIPLSSEGDLNVLLKTGYRSPVAIALAKSLMQEAGIPFFAMDQNLVARQESGNVIGWWNVRVPREREAEAREILESIERSEAVSGQ